MHFYSQVLLIGSFNFNFSSQYIFLELTSCNNTNIVLYNVNECETWRAISAVTI